MKKGDTFTYNGKLWQFDSYFQYKPTKDQPNPPKLVAARRWIKTTQKFSGNALLICRADQIEPEAGA